jgi:hypothetical protein
MVRPDPLMLYRASVATLRRASQALIELPVGAQWAARFRLKPDAIDAPRYDIEIIGSHLPARRFRAQGSRMKWSSRGVQVSFLAVRAHLQIELGAAPPLQRLRKPSECVTITDAAPSTPPTNAVAGDKLQRGHCSGREPDDAVDLVELGRVLRVHPFPLGILFTKSRLISALSSGAFHLMRGELRRKRRHRFSIASPEHQGFFFWT